MDMAATQKTWDSGFQANQKQQKIEQLLGRPGWLHVLKESPR